MGILPSGNTLFLWKDFRGQKGEDKTFGHRASCWRRQPRPFMHPDGDLQSCMGAEHRDSGPCQDTLPTTSAVGDCHWIANRSPLAPSPQGWDGNLPRSPGLGNLQESLYVEYCGWLYGLPENSLPKLKRKRQNKRSFYLRPQLLL